MASLNNILPVVALVSSITVSQSANALEYLLKYDTWELVAIPADLPADANSPLAVFGDEILASDPEAVYGKDWVMYSFDSGLNDYVELLENDPIETEKGFWVIQTVADELKATLPDGSLLTIGPHGDALAAELGCSPGQIMESGETEGWKCADQEPASCPSHFANLVTSAENPVSHGGRPLSKFIQEHSNFCTMQYAADDQFITNPTYPLYTLDIYIPDYWDKSQIPAGDVPSWKAKVEFGGQEKIWESDDLNPPDAQEILACAKLIGACFEIRNMISIVY